MDEGGGEIEASEKQTPELEIFLSLMHSQVLILVYMYIWLNRAKDVGGTRKSPKNRSVKT